MRTASLLSTVAVLLLGGCNLYFGGQHQPPPIEGDDVMWIPDAGTPNDDGGSPYGDASTGWDGGGPPGDAQCNALNCTGDPIVAAEMQWAACLSISASELTSTQAYKVATLTTDAGTCASCHGAGEAATYLSTSQSAMLYAWQEQAFVTSVFAAAPEPGPGGEATYGIAVDDTTLCAKGTEKANGTGTHPAYDCHAASGGIGALEALHAFHDLVQGKLNAGECPAPAFAP